MSDLIVVVYLPVRGRGRPPRRSFDLLGHVHAGLLRCVLLALLHHGHAVGLLLVGVLLPAVLLELLLGDHGLLSSVRTSLGLVILIGVGIELLLLVGLLLLLLLEALMSAAAATAAHAAAICFASEGAQRK